MFFKIVITIFKETLSKKVILLIDEYDVSLQSAYKNGYYEEMVDFLRAVFSSSLKTNDVLEKGIMTGCLRISKDTDRRAELSIFTGLNNLKVYSILDYRNSHYFGFSQKEVDELLDSYGLIQYREEVKQVV